MSSCSSVASFLAATVFSRKVATWGTISESTLARDPSLAIIARKLSLRVETLADTWRMCTTCLGASKPNYSLHRPPKSQKSRPELLLRKLGPSPGEESTPQFLTKVALSRQILPWTSKSARILTPSSMSKSITTLTVNPKHTKDSQTSKVLFSQWMRGMSCQRIPLDKLQWIQFLKKNLSHRLWFRTKPLQIVSRTPTRSANSWNSKMFSINSRLDSLAARSPTPKTWGLQETSKLLPDQPTRWQRIRRSPWARLIEHTPTPV